MPKYVIERDIPGAGKLSPQELQAISQKSCGVLSNLGPRINWVHSYVTGDKIYCIYHATDEKFAAEIHYWTTPQKDCVDGSGSNCTAYQDWVDKWQQIKG